MLIQIRMLDEIGMLIFDRTTEVDVLDLMSTAKSREESFLAKGAESIADRIPILGQEFAEAFQSGEAKDAIKWMAVSIAMIVWMDDHLLGETEAEVFERSHLLLTVEHDGTITYERLTMDAS